MAGVLGEDTKAGMSGSMACPQNESIAEGRAVPDQELRMENKGGRAKPKGAFMFHSGFGTLSSRQTTVATGLSPGLTRPGCASEFRGNINLEFATI